MLQNVSKELYNSVPKLKPGQQMVYELLGVRYDKNLRRVICPNSRNVPSTDRIWDRFAQGGEGDWADMRLIDSITPSQDPNSLVREHINIRKIYFRREQRGQIVVSGDRKEDEELHVYLYLSNYNASNQGKDGWVRPKSGPRYRLLEPAKTDQEALDVEQKIWKAGAKIMEMDDVKLYIVARGLSLRGVNQHTAPSTIRKRLIDMTKQPDGLDKILRLDEDTSLEVLALIKNAQEQGLIFADKAAKRWVWTESQDRICGIAHGKSADVSLKDFLVSEDGSETFEMLQIQMSQDPLEEVVLEDEDK